MSKYINYLIISIAAIINVYAFPAYAASTTQTSPGMATAPILLALAIAYVTRRMSIGGWLFYYYLILYGSILMNLFLGVLTIENYNPAGWENETIYILFLISTLPLYIILLVEMIFATKLLIKSKRNPKNVKILRNILVASVIINLIIFGIDYSYFPDNLAISGLALFLSGIWCSYFIVSERVKYVFENWSGNWDYQSFKDRKTIKSESPPNLNT